MPESVYLSMILGNALVRSLSLSSNSSWCICFKDNDANQALVGSAPHVVPVPPDCRREIREPYKRCGLTDTQKQENIHEKRQGTHARIHRLLVKRSEEGGGDVCGRWRL